MTRVAVIGGGIGGLTAAQELAERNFTVDVYEATGRFGGKARSYPVGQRGSLHGEHGFRFFPAFYRHVVETMQRIPTAEGTVADNLVVTEETLVASTDQPAQRARTGQPESVREWMQTLRPAFIDDLPPEDRAFLLERFLYILTACDQRREHELDNVSWWEFIDADNRSPALRERLAAATQALVALRPRLASARTMGVIYLQLLFGQMDPTRPAERILNGPTSEVWIHPWVEYLDSLGVELHPNTPVERLLFDGRRITGAERADGNRIEADEFVLAVPVHVAPDFLTPEITSAAPELAGIERLDTAWMNGIQFYLSTDRPLTRGHQVYTDSPWALTSISQRQFWSGHDFERASPDDVEGVLSVIASDWERPGIVYGRPAKACTRAEIATEVWEQLKAHLNATEDVLTDDVLVEWFLDPAIVETDNGVENRSPLLINTVGSLKHRPPAETNIENLGVAGDFVRTNSDLASMESANEAGRRVANAILRRHRPDTPEATIWTLEEPAVFEPFRRQDRLQYRLGLPHPAEVTQSARSFVNRLGVRG